MNNFQKKMILRALDAEDKLTEWEWDFVNSLAELDDSEMLTEKQNKILMQISERVG